MHQINYGQRHVTGNHDVVQDLTMISFIIIYTCFLVGYHDHCSLSSETPSYTPVISVLRAMNAFKETMTHHFTNNVNRSQNDGPTHTYMC